jgi:hypothetical protein
VHVPVGGGGDLGDFGSNRGQRNSTVDGEQHGVTLCCHVPDAFAVDGAGEDNSGHCALSSLSLVQGCQYA